MLLVISPEELIEPYKESWKLGHITNPTIDYADNSLYAIFEGKQVIIFKFNKYGWLTDNRYNQYLVSAGSAGVLINIII